MSLFRSLNTRFEQSTELQPERLRPWPAIYRQPLPHLNINEYSLQLRIENQLPKVMNQKQLTSLPMFNESRRITSKAGWTYYGQWRGLTFQTLFSLFSTPHLYPWVRIEGLNGEHYIIDYPSLMNYRIIMEGEGEPLSLLYGGPIWIHNFDFYVEYGIPYVKSIILMQGEHAYNHPSEALGFKREEARVLPGQYYGMHHERMITL